MPLTPPAEQPNNPYLPGLPGINTGTYRNLTLHRIRQQVGRKVRSFINV